MAFEIKQSLRLSQSLVMTPQLQQAIKLLQLSRMEMQELITKELVENPMLEEADGLSDTPVGEESQGEASDNSKLERQEAEGMGAEESMQPTAENKVVEGKAEFDWEEYIESFASSPSMPNTREVPDELPNFENMVSNTTDLTSHLDWQVSMTNFTEEERKLASHIIGNLNEDGYFTGSLEEIVKELNFDLEDAEEVLKTMQQMDPLGVCARDLRECLLAQAKVRQPGNKLLKDLISNHLHDIENRNYPNIAKALGVPVEDVYGLTKLILELNPKPGREYASSSDTQYITPDIYVYKVGDDYSIVLNEEGIPKLRVSGYYRNLLQQARAEAKQKGVNSKEYIQEKLRSAVWLIKSINNRQKTIFRVMESIVKYQRDFFEQGVHALKPMVLREVANDIGVHESTISRVTTNKYVHTPVGIFELKYFFNSGISSGSGGVDVASESVKQKIKDLVTKEDPRRPLSDQKLVQLLGEQNIEIARRTVAKYRESLGILSSSRRKKLF
jgi:RNA polymerase sigma-54 factor